jgi:probable phosphoglycerate mutase
MPALPGTACRRRIYLMRRAEVSYFSADGTPFDPRTFPLPPRGREQAAASAAPLADIPFDLAVCSGLTRTVETARIVLGERPLALAEEPRLKEVRAGRVQRAWLRAVNIAPYDPLRADDPLMVMEKIYRRFRAH